MVLQLPKSLETFVEPFSFKIFIDENEKTWKMPFEWHESLEIFYVLEGVGTFFIEDKRYEFKKGDLFVIGNYELHKSELINGQMFKALIVMFDKNLSEVVDVKDDIDPLKVFFDRPADFSHQLTLGEELHEKIMFIFKQMINEVEMTAGPSPKGIAALLQWLLIELSRAYENKKWINTVRKYNGLNFRNVVNKMLDYIDKHYKQDIHLESVAQELNVSASYLSREFKKSLGFSLIEFITSKRIRSARELLRNTSLSVTDIASEVGYNNVTHFHWTFKKLVGISPGQYRKMSRVYKN
jgi:YesN/AraC family two-component response regulator